MKGYQLTAADLAFIEKMKEEKLVKKLQVVLAFSLPSADYNHVLDCRHSCTVFLLRWPFADEMGYLHCPQGDLAEVQKLLRREIMALQRAFAAREREQAGLNKVSHLIYSKHGR